ncbi:hypothetical protein BU24DRAFT_465163 [Aaosphaeria arxii CBS 175.79]|uniref:Uncharacterized protein n=1 Tax=Aaosphaeria arxii CBS 175.79 TaxID=1450172 RepID=A0A6A5XIW8_9PLEO|nr:uncharacterized protein BU24DRAFT_465163 [Aaosphaeria arxii CBS 175.79]KAF2012806.1 hypothetical protein BU24DRAFT_465163 [Aaosphaeria arxii CBS 175.79]
MSVGRLQAALGAVTNEFTAAAANINFDFTLIKVEAPKEFQPLGDSLALVKRAEAESGSAHVLARELGALFTGICPKTPQLLKAYGTRVSEISEASKKRFGNQGLGSIFSEYSGIDGTAIWAAATSSEVAIQAHLLACMIARIFEPPQAVAIWVEMVRARKSEVADKVECGEQVPFALVNVACRRDIRKTELAEWDASIRAWMNTADDIKKDEAMKLRDLLKTVQYPVNSNTNLYQSVTEAWRSSLESMEKLIRGEPLSIQDGAILLGLSSWHLYPNLKIFTSQIEVNMDDSLIHPGGVLSLGLSPLRNNARGVYWCLSLAHLRHYGKPVRTEQRLQHDSTRITFPEFMFAALGALLGRWEVQFDEINSAMEVLYHVCDSLSRESEATQSLSWAATIRDTVQKYIEVSKCESDSATRLLLLGRRRFRSFIGEADDTNTRGLRSNPGCFGLLGYSHLLGCLKNHEARIKFLRYLMSRCPKIEVDHCLIQYRVDWGITVKSNRSLSSENLKFPESSSGPRIPHSRPYQISSTERGNVSDDDLSEFSVAIESLSEAENEKDDKKGPFHYATVGPSSWEPICKAMTCPKVLATMTQQHVGSTYRRWAPTQDCDAKPDTDEQSLLYDASSILSTSSVLSTTSHIMIPTSGAPYWLRLVLGDIDSAAIFCNEDVTQTTPDIDFLDISWCFDQDLICCQRLKDHIRKRRFNDITEFLISLNYAQAVYKYLPDARIAIQSLEHKFTDLECFPRTRYGRRHRIVGETHTNPLSTPSALSLVAFLDSGSCSLHTGDLADVMAVSIGDSLYFPRQIMCDPSERPAPYHLERILGNVGKAGLALLMPPQAPMIREIDYKRLMSLQQTIFDAKNEDCFRGTSVHLSFTDHQVPIFDNHAREGIDSQVCILESVISIQDYGKWVADVDILRALKSRRLSWDSMKRECIHTNREVPHRPPLSIEDWDDVINFSNDRFVVRAHGNWLARLATTSVLIQLFEEKNIGKVTICGSNTCWNCCLEESTIPHAFIM